MTRPPLRPRCMTATRRSAPRSPTSAAGSCPCATRPTSPSTTPCARPPASSTSRTWPSSCVDGRGPGRSSTTRSPARSRRCAVGKAKYCAGARRRGRHRRRRHRVPHRRRALPRVANAGNRDAVGARRSPRASRGSTPTLDDAHRRHALIAVQGPAARDPWSRPTPASSIVAPSARRPALLRVATGCVRRTAPLLVARTGYTGEDGFELLHPRRVRAGACGTRCSPPANRSDWSPPVSPRATRCAWRPGCRSTATSSRSTSCPHRPGSAASSRSTRTTSSASPASRRS